MVDLFPRSIASFNFRTSARYKGVELEQTLNFIDNLVCYRIERSKDEDEQAKLLELHKVSHLLRAENDIDFFDRTDVDFGEVEATKAVDLPLVSLAKLCDEKIREAVPDYQANLFQARYQSILDHPADAFDPLMKALKDDTKQHLIILDVDNTLRNDVLVDQKNLYPDISEKLMKSLIELNSRSNVKIAILTGRDKEELQRSNFKNTPLNLWSSYGFQHLRAGNEIKGFVKPDRDALVPEALLIDRLDKAGVSRSDYRMVTNPGKAYVFIDKAALNETRRKVKDALRGFKQNGWTLIDNKNRYFTLKEDGHPASDKGLAIPTILGHFGVENNAKDWNVYMFGDSGPDLEAMKALNKELGDSGAGIYNCAVGWCLGAEEAITHRLPGYQIVEKLLTKI